MADFCKNKEGGPATVHEEPLHADEGHSLDVTDDFDPFGVFECVDVGVDNALAAPHQSMWYHGRLDRSTAEDCLKMAGKLGSYLIRESDRHPGTYSLSYLGCSGINHFRVIAMCGDYYIGGREFDNLSDLIGYYINCSDLLKGERLIHPVPPSKPINDVIKVVATLPYNKTPDTDELSFQCGEVFTVHNELGDGWLWVESHSTNKSGIVYKDLVKYIDGNSDKVEANLWYHFKITNTEVKERLAQVGPGGFLVRPSETHPGDCTLLFLADPPNIVQRFRIQHQGRQYVMGGRYYDSLAAIIERYKREQIVDGHVLSLPVNRKVTDQCDAKQSQDIYNSMRQSSGSNFFINRRDNVIMKGYLNKKSSKTKKWKNMYFVLNDTDKMLYYFESHKRTKPKGLIELRDTSLYPVHDSFFGRPNCYQLVMCALNHYQLYYLCADNADLAQGWIHALKPYCRNTKTTLNKHVSADSHLTELRSLTLCIKDARKLPIKYVPHPYCIVSLNDTKVCRTQIKEAPDPIWEEEFSLDDIPMDIISFNVTIYNKGRRSKDTEVGQVVTYLANLPPGEMVDEWYLLCPVNQTIKGEVGSLRVTSRFKHEVVMPLKVFTSLKELLLTKDFETIHGLASICGNDRISLASALLQIFRHEKQEALLLKTLNNAEVWREESVANLFRGASLATTLMDQYMRTFAHRFVQMAVQDPINKILDGKSCELNPNLLENQSELVVNKQHLLSLLNEVVQSIFKSIEACPLVLRYICGCLQKSVQKRWEGDTTVKTRAVSSFIFLRLLCPAILNPKSFNLITETPSQVANRTLKLVAKSLINLANLVEFGAKEPFMEAVNPFIVNNKQRMIMFVDELSNVPASPVTEDSPVIDADVRLARSLATVHQICVAHTSSLQMLSQEKPQLKKLLTVTEMLSKGRRHYISEADRY